MTRPPHTQPADDALPPAKHHAHPPAIILVKPQLGQNIGMVARAMLNCGVTDLRIVAPRDGWPQETAYSTAAGADVVLDNATIHETTADAVKGLTYVAASTARMRGMTKPVVSPAGAAAEIIARNTGDVTTCGLLFGAERTGLENEDIVLSDAILNIPLNPHFTSLNIAQAVLLVCYQWHSYSGAMPDWRLETNEGDIAPRDKINYLVDRLEEELVRANFFKNPDMQPSVMQNLRNTFIRMNLTDQEARTMHGVISALIERR